MLKENKKIGRNPKNAAVPIIIPARAAVKFTPGKKMRQVIEKKKHKPSGPTHQGHGHAGPHSHQAASSH